MDNQNAPGIALMIGIAVLSLVVLGYDYFYTYKQDITQVKTEERIVEPVPSPSCPNGYTMVEKNGNNAYFFDKENSTLSGKDYFCVMTYEAKCDTDKDNIGDYPNEEGLLRGQSFNWSDCTTSSAVSSPDGAPIVNITQEESKSACSGMGEGYHLITNDEWMAIARDVESVKQNWNENVLFRGNSDNKYVVSGFDGASSGSNSRYLYLSNGSIVWDMSGNAWEWLSDTIKQNNQPPYSGWYEINVLDDYGLVGKENISSANQNLGSINGIGKLFLAFSPNSEREKAFLRGGSWGDGNRAGIYTLDFLNAPSDYHEYMGFRCVKTY